MKGEAQPMIKFFDGSDKRFIIPLYQRNYDWTIENCNQLFEDLMKLHRNPDRSSHFFGSLVSSIESGSDTRYIIDGQQRITTISLLLIAIVNTYNEGRIKADDQRLPEKIFKRYIVDEYQEDERKVRLKPIKKDMESFDALIYKEKGQYIQTSNVTKNYNFFYEKIVQYGLTVDEYFNCIKKLEIINIKLDDSDDPQLIFESLNSTGLDLTEADKIRNYLLMSLSPSEQDSMYTKYWNPIEEATHYNPTPFVRDYLTMKLGKIGRIDRIYFLFKEYAESKGISRQELLCDMEHFSSLYKKITDAEFKIDVIDDKLKQMSPLEPSVAYPFLLPFFNYASDRLSDIEQYAVLDLIENYYSRRIICNEPSNALSKVFATLHRDVVNQIDRYVELCPDSPAPSYQDVLSYMLLNKDGSSRFPCDGDVSDNFATRQVYKIPSNARAFLLERLENRDSKEKHDVIGQLKEQKISIEHIMPQTLSDEWKKALGANYDEIHKQYLHTIANLTLTGYNSAYSNNAFADKRDVKHGFNDSAYRLNNYVKSCTKWTKEELDTRQEELLKVFFSLWPYPVTSFEPAKKEAESASLDDMDFEFSGRKLQAFRYLGVRYPATTWKEMLVQVCSLVFMANAATVDWICANDKYNLHLVGSVERAEFAEGHFVWSSSNTESKIGILRGLLDECGIDKSELVFEFLPATPATDNDMDGEPEVSVTTQFKTEFWTGFISCMKDSEDYNRHFNIHSHTPKYAYDLPVGKSSCNIYLALNQTQILAGLYFKRKDTLGSLEPVKEKINASLSQVPEWEPFKKAGHIVMRRPFKLQDRDSYNDAYRWLLARAIELLHVAQEFVK